MRRFSEKTLGRTRAAGVHLCANLAVALALMLVVTQVWYPAPLFDLAKGREIFLLLIACDVVLGPVMTAIVFDITKPRSGLVRDVAIIAVIQLAALGYGLDTLVSARPAYVVYNAGQFNVPLANELISSVTDKTPRPVPAPWWGPRLVGSRMPEDHEERTRLMFSSVLGQGDVYQIPRYFVAYDDVRADVIGHARDLDQIARELRVDPARVRRAMTPFDKSAATYGILPLVIRNTTGLAVVDRKSGDLLAILALPPAI